MYMYTKFSVHVAFLTTRIGYTHVQYCTLKILPTDETGVDVIVGERHRAEFFEVKVEDGSVDGVQIRAAPT